MPPLVYDADHNQFDVETADPDQSSEIYNVSSTTQVIAVPEYGIDTRISNLNSSIDSYVEEREAVKAKRCLKRIEAWESVKDVFQTEALPEDALNGDRQPYTPSNEDSVDAVLIPRVWIENKIEEKQEERNTCIGKEHLDWADYYRVQREVYEKFILKRNAEFTVQREILDEATVEKIEQLE